MRRFLVFLCGLFVVAGLRSEPLSQALNDVGTASSVTGADSIVIVQGGVGKKADVNLFETIYQPLDSDLTIFAGITPSANVQSLLGAADYAAIRTQLALVIGTNVQAYDADLTTYAGITPSANVQSLLGAADYAAIRTQLGLVIGTNVQAYDADLTIYAGITPSANVQSLLGAADYAAMRSQLGLVIGTNVQAYDADLDDLADGSLTGTKVGFADTDSNFTATNVQAAIEELDDTNGSGPNAADGKVAWSQLVGIPAGFADGSDDGSGGSSGTLNTIKEDGSQLGGSDIVALDFLGADFDLTESPDTEVNIVVAGAITRDTEWDTAAEINSATTDNDFVISGGALGTPSSGTVTNLTGTASININGTVGATTPAAGTFTTLVAGNTTSLLLGTAGSAVGNIGFRNATSGTATLAPPTGALGTYTVTLPNAASTLPIFGQQITFSGPSAARTVTFPDANFTAARTDAANTFTGVQTMTSPVINTKIQMPTAAGASTLTTGGDMAVNTTNKQIGIHNGAKEVGVPLIQHKTWSFDPDAVCDGAVDRLFLMSTGVDAPFGITVVGWKVSFEADPTTEVDLDLKRADAFIGVANSAVMDVLDTTAGASSESTAANINGGAVVANGNVLYLEFGTAYTETTHQIIFEIWYEIEED